MPLVNPPVPATGTAFPIAPAANDRFLRTDRHIEYFYDGTRWLSAEQHSIQIAMQDIINPLAATSSHRLANPWTGQYDMYVEQFVSSSNNAAVTSANYITTQLVARSTAATNIGSALSCQNDTQNAWIAHRTQPNTVIGSTNFAIEVGNTATGIPSSYMSSSIIYRLVG